MEQTNENDSLDNSEDIVSDERILNENEEDAEQNKILNDVSLERGNPLENIAKNLKGFSNQLKKLFFSPAAKKKIIKNPPVNNIKKVKIPEYKTNTYEVSAAGGISNEIFFETLLMLIILFWLLRWLFGFRKL
ncbi:MAG: hypothetical protein ACOYVD_17095 [Bacillota bacterium]